MSNTQQPAFTAYAVSKRGDENDDWWNPIGAAFPHQDGQGFNIILQAMPLNGKIVLRPPKDKDEDEQPPVKNTQRRNDKRRER